MKGLTFNQREQARLRVLNQVLEGGLRVSQAARLLGVSERHGWRLLAAYRREGAAALAHGNRGQASTHRVPEEVNDSLKSTRLPMWGDDRKHTHPMSISGRLALALASLGTEGQDRRAQHGLPTVTKSGLITL